MGKSIQFTKRTVKSQILALFLSSIALSSIHTAPTDNIDVKLGISTSYFRQNAKEVKYYQVRMDPSKFSGKEDLIVKVIESETQGDPDIYLSKTNNKPNSRANSDIACESSGRDVCTVNHKQLIKGQNIYIGVKCLEDCKYLLKANIFEPVILEDGQDEQIDFATDESKLFKYYVPAASAAKDADNRVNSVTLAVQPLLQQSDNIILTATALKDGTATSKSFRGVPGWKKGQVLRLSEHFSEDWCNDCWVNILVDVQDPGKYQVIAKSNVGLQKLETNKIYEDVSFFGDKNCYKYYVQSSENDMVLKINQYSGLISFTINPKKPAESFDKAAFQYIGTQSSLLRITPRDRKKESQLTGLYYICAVPHMTSTYSIQISEPKLFEDFSYLEDGYDEMGELQGKSIKSFVYKVPSLEYEFEDIDIDVKLEVKSGKSPSLYGKFCEEKNDPKKCGKIPSDEEFVQSYIDYQSGIRVGQILSITFNHDETKCKIDYSNNCYYSILVYVDQDPEELSTFIISASHSQRNHRVLKEGTILQDFVTINSYKYYSFTLFQDKDARNVTFKLNTIHGDADIYVSRINPQPDKLLYEKSSVKSNIDVESVTFGDGDGEISTTYYVAVFSFQYSTFNLLVKVDREGATNQVERIPQLKEGEPFSASIKGKGLDDHYKIYVRQTEGYEQSIKIQISPIRGKFDLYVRYGDKAGTKQWTWSTSDNNLEIKTNDVNFKREGYYYILVHAKTSLWSKFVEDSYAYTILYTTQQGYQYLNAQQAIQNSQQAKTNQYFRHFVTYKDQDLSVSMTVFSGNPLMYISIDPSNKLPSQQKNDFTSKNQAVIQGNKGKSIYIPSSQIQKNNPQCRGGTQSPSSEPCAMFITVYCETDCKYSLKLAYEQGAPRKVVVGVPQHDIVKKDGFNYYYLVVTQYKVEQVYAVLNSLIGKAMIYVNFQDNPQNKAPDEWNLPTTSRYAMRSDFQMRQDMISISNDNLKDCFSRHTDTNVAAQCAIVFGVHQKPEDSQKLEADDSIRYNFVVYTDILFLQNGAPVSGKVDEREFQYYLFEASCLDCPIVISLSTFGNGDPDLYISQGENQLPTLTNFDLYSSTFKSELVRISLDSSEIQAKGIKNLKGSWIVGVYGVKKSEYSISVTQEKNPISTLVSGYSLKVTQEPFESTYFMYYHDRDQVDMLIQINPKVGKVDVYVQTFKDDEQSQNFADRLPKSKRNARWIKDSISSTSTMDEKQLIILNDEKDYCSNCYYLIAVVSHDVRSEYTILAHYFEATFENVLLLKLGETQHYSIKANEKVYFRFIIEERESFQVQLTQLSGMVYTKIYDARLIQTPIEFSQSKSITIDKSDQFIKAGEMYYILVQETQGNDARISILLNQERHIQQLSDGIPLKVDFMKNDLTRHFIFSLPKGEQQVDITVKSNYKDFTPILMYRYSEDVNNRQSLQFPPSGKLDFNYSISWDRGIEQLSQEAGYNVKNETGGLLITLQSYEYMYEKLNGSLPTLYITVTTTSMVVMVPRTQYFGQLKTPTSFKMYQIDQDLHIRNGFLLIDFANCQGKGKVSIVDKPDGHQSLISKVDLSPKEELGRTFLYVPLPRDNLFIMVKVDGVQEWDGKSQFDQVDFMIKVRLSLNNQSRTTEFHYQVNNRISLNGYMLMSGLANLTWNPIMWSDQFGTVSKVKATYSMTVTQDSSRDLNSVCGIRRKEYSEDTRYYDSDTTFFNVPQIMPGKTYFVNVYAKAQVPFTGEEEILPYDAYELHIRESIEFSAKNMFILLILIAICGGAIYICRKLSKKEKPFYKPKEVSHHVEYELTNVNGNRTGEYVRPVVNDLNDNDPLNSSTSTLDNESKGGLGL
ncbi:UNKNOWN [Stylonychia lemnae]|uniref:Transmembrane protein n=1 Tax=Stylonychia lemnae TaxID=5949 RepID=A0A078BB82_STYLE|nr:UNKNOWN [Stylonychia lemnae]|eukprot:CDW91451.1 UNKNOWN [Stylonychia lemnae]